MNAWLAQREQEKGTGKFDRKERTLPGGMKATTYTRRHEEEPIDGAEASTEPKRKGRPKGKDKGPERVTAKSYKYKAGRPAKTQEDVDVDGVMMKRPTTCSNESFSPETEKILRHQETISKLVDLIKNSGDLIDPKLQRKLGPLLRELLRGDIDEEKVEAGKRHFFDKLAPAVKQAAKVMKVMSKGKEAVEEEGLEKNSTSALKAASSKDRKADQKSGVPAQFSTAQLKAELAKRSKVEEESKVKEEKVEETTVAGSVATASTSGKSKGGMSFGKGVYEGMSSRVESIINESIRVESTMEECGDSMEPTLTIQADGEEAAKLMMLLKLAGLGNHSLSAEVVDENSPDWPTDTETLSADPELRTYSGGLNGPKSTGQSTTVGGGIPNLQARRQASMEESVKLEQSLFNTWKNYKG
jgi:hypothetical protein